jgi:CDP-glucose 4,6-dehydratase
MVEKILSLMGKKLDFEVRDEATNEIPHQYLSAKRAREQLGWHPLFSLDEGLKKTIEWYRKFVSSEND